VISYATFFVAGVNLANGQSLGYAWIEFPSTWTAFFGAFLDYCLRPRAGKEERHRAMEQLNGKGADFLALPMFINWIGSGNYDMELATPNWALPSVDMSTFHHVMFFWFVFPFSSGFILFAFGRLIGFILLTTRCLNAPWLETGASRVIFDQAGSLFWRL